MLVYRTFVQRTLGWSGR